MLQICVQLSREAAIQVTVPLTVLAGSAQQNVDFTISSQSLTFPAGVVENCTSISVIGDAILEDSEVFTLSLQSSETVISTSDATVMIVDQNSAL